MCAYARTGRQRPVLVLPTKGKLAVHLVYTILYVPDVSATLLIAYYARSTRGALKSKCNTRVVYWID